MNQDFLEAITALEKEKNISKETLFEAIEAALISAYKHNFNSATNVRVHMNRETGEIKVFARLEITDVLDEPSSQITLQEARKTDPGYEIGDILEKEVTPRNFGRIAAQSAKQVVVQRIKEAERESIYDQYIDRVDDIVTGIVERFEQRNVIISLGKTEAILPPQEQMPSGKYERGQRLKTYVTEVKRTTKGPQIFVSRTHPGLLKRLFELEVSEIFEGIVEIKSVSREAGHRSKVAVYARNPDIDPVGACVGKGGQRVNMVVNELEGEKIDIIRWNEDEHIFIANSLSPAVVNKVYLEPTSKTARVVVPDNQLSLAIGKEGQNARLAARLTGWKIDINCESEAAEKNLVDEDLPLKDARELLMGLDPDKNSLVTPEEE